MSVSSTSNASTAQNIQIDVMKKAQDVQAQQVLKVLESANEQSQQVAAQKTGVGQNINIMA
ncbi:MAG: putative motility protein [Sulfurimonas sp.]